MLGMASYDVRFKFPFAWLLAGGSGCGKTTKVLNFLRNHKDLTDNPDCENVVYFYNQWQSQFDNVGEDVVNCWIEGLPTHDRVAEVTESFKDRGGSIVIIDDFAHALNEEIERLFTVFSHHGNCALIFLSQNLFDKNKHFRTVSLNSQYITAFKNPRDRQQIAALARQLRPDNSKFIVDSYHKATQAPFSYLFFDNHQRTPEEIRIRSRILPHESPMLVWQEKNGRS